MSTKRKRIVLLRNSSSSPLGGDEYVERLQGLGFDVSCMAALNTVYAPSCPRSPDWKDFSTLLSSPRDNMVTNATKEFAGMVFTSSRAVQWLQTYLAEMSNARLGIWTEGWKECAEHLFCVGERTRKTLLSVIGTHLPNAFVHCASSAVELAPLMTRVLQKGTVCDCGKVLHLCGDKTLPILKESLAADGITLVQLVVYRTAMQEVNLLSHGEESGHALWICFFSPSGVDAVHESRAFPGVDEFNHGNYVCCAFGRSTAARMREIGLTVACVAHSPTPEGLSLAVEHFLQGRNSEAHE